MQVCAPAPARKCLPIVWLRISSVCALGPTRAQVSCYRVYDADMPEYSLAIDLYQTVPDGMTWLYVQEYAAPATVDAQAARRRRGEALSVLTEVCGVPPERIRVRLRRKTARGEQYGKLDEQSTFHVVEEGGLKFRVNFDDYLDTGLFLDHRLDARALACSRRRHALLESICIYRSCDRICCRRAGRSRALRSISRTLILIGPDAIWH